MKKFVLITVISLSCFAVNSQTTHLHNPSFEGTVQPHVAPIPWETSFDGGTPDTQPGTWGITLPASDGNTYISALMSGDSVTSYSEGVSQELVTCLTPGQSYTISLDLAHSTVYNTAEPLDCYSSLAIWGGYTSGHKGELLWTSGVVTDTTWQTYVTTFIPNDDWCYLSFGPYYITTCNGYVNILLDNIGGDLVGITEDAQKIKTGIYPNPAKNTITISTPYLKNQAAALRIYNTNGQLVKVETNLTGQTNSVDVATLAAGLYYYTVTTVNGFGSGKFIKE
jgi:hypothetical protein